MDSREYKRVAPQSGTEDGVKKEQVAMSEAERVQNLRERLYARGGASPHVQRHVIPAQKASVSTAFTEHQSDQSTQHVESPVQLDVPHISDTQPVITKDVNVDKPMAKKRSYRKIITIVGIVFFAGAMAVASAIMFLGNNTISGENITVTVTGQIGSGGGEELPFQVAIANQNAVPIQSATLIIEYPKGTQNPVDGKDMTIERKSLDDIKAGELVNVELKARVFGEENDEKEIKVSIEYRITGSGATLKKSAEPYVFKISKSPVVATFKTLKTTSSGQEHVLELIVQSNVTTPLENILVKVSYPGGFDYNSAEPETTSGEDTWRLKELKPGEKRTITIKGTVTGYDDEVRKFTAVIGVAEDSHKTTLDSILAQASTEVVIERPFLDTVITVNGQNAETVVIGKTQNVNVSINFENTLDTTVFDARILVEVQGNALDEYEIDSQDGGYYDSRKNVISWDGIAVSALKEILPGQGSRVSFQLIPNADANVNPTITLKVTTRGQRIFDNNVSQEVVGTTKQVINIESALTFYASGSYKDGPFENTGPMPPIAEETTEFTLGFHVQAGKNSITDAKVTAVLPVYVTWLERVSGDDVIEYDKNKRRVTWLVGKLDPDESKDAYFQVSMTPSLSQVRDVPILMGDVGFVATDSHTETQVESRASSVYTNFPTDGSNVNGDGTVRKPE